MHLWDLSFFHSLPHKPLHPCIKDSNHILVLNALHSRVTAPMMPRGWPVHVGCSRPGWQGPVPGQCTIDPKSVGPKSLGSSELLGAERTSSLGEWPKSSVLSS